MADLERVYERSAREVEYFSLLVAECKDEAQTRNSLYTSNLRGIAAWRWPGVEPGDYFGHRIALLHKRQDVHFARLRYKHNASVALE